MLSNKTSISPKIQKNLFQITFYMVAHFTWKYGKIGKWQLKQKKPVKGIKKNL